MWVVDSTLCPLFCWETSEKLCQSRPIRMSRRPHVGHVLNHEFVMFPMILRGYVFLLILPSRSSFQIFFPRSRLVRQISFKKSLWSVLETRFCPVRFPVNRSSRGILLRPVGRKDFLRAWLTGYFSPSISPAMLHQFYYSLLYAS